MVLGKRINLIILRFHWYRHFGFFGCYLPYCISAHIAAKLGKHAGLIEYMCWMPTS